MFHVHILNTHLALFQPSEIRTEDSKPSRTTWISSMNIKKSENVKGTSQKGLIILETNLEI